MTDLEKQQSTTIKRTGTELRATTNGISDTINRLAESVKRYAESAYLAYQLRRRQLEQRRANNESTRIKIRSLIDNVFLADTFLETFLEMVFRKNTGI